MPTVNISAAWSRPALAGPFSRGQATSVGIPHAAGLHLSPNPRHPDVKTSEAMNFLCFRRCSLCVFFHFSKVEQ